MRLWRVLEFRFVSRRWTTLPHRLQNDPYELRLVASGSSFRCRGLAAQLAVMIMF